MPYTPTSTLQSRIEYLRGPQGSYSLGSGIARGLRGWKANRLDKELQEKNQANDSVRQEEMRRLMNVMSGTQVPMQPGVSPSFTHPDVQELATALRLQRAQPKDLMTVGENSRLYDPNSRSVVLDAAPDPTNYNQPFLPNGMPNQPYQDYQKGLRESGRSNTNVTVNNQGDNAFLGRLGPLLAEDYMESKSSAESAYQANQALDRIVMATDGADQGALAPVFSGIKNVLASFGYAPDGLEDNEAIEQAISEILSTRMGELGARGLTDADMRVLRDALPRLNSSAEARLEAARVIKKANAAKIQNYIDQTTQYDERYREQLEIPTPPWYEQYLQSLNAADAIVGE